MVAVGGAAPRLVCSNGRSASLLAVLAEGNEEQAAYHRGGLRTCVATQGLGHLKILKIPSLLGSVFQDDFVHLLSPWPFKTFKVPAFILPQGSWLWVPTHSLSLGFCFSVSLISSTPCNVSSVLPGQITRAGYLAVLCFHSLPTLILFLPPVSWGWGSARVPPGHGFVSYPFCEMLSSCRYRCKLDVVLYFLVFLLGIVVFAVFSKCLWFC